MNDEGSGGDNIDGIRVGGGGHRDEDTEGGYGGRQGCIEMPTMRL